MFKQHSRRIAAAVATLALVGTGLAPAQASSTKTATASWIGDTGQVVAIGNKTGACVGCTRYTLTKISGDGDLTFTPRFKRAVGPDGKRYIVTTLATTSANAGIWEYRLTFYPGKSTRPSFTTNWTLTFRGDPILTLPDQNYWVSQSAQNITLQDIKVHTNSHGARTYSVLDTNNTAGCSLVPSTSKIHFVRVGHCQVRVSVAADGIFRAASTVATINVLSSYTYSVTVYGWVQRTRTTTNDIALSRARAQSVRRYLVAQGVHVSKFRVVQGKGAKSRANAARQATVNISWSGVTSGTKSTTVYFTPLSSQLSLFAMARLRVLWSHIPRA